MTTPDTPNTPVSVTQIAELLAWARALTEAGPNADPADRAAYQTAKTALLARITHQSPTTDTDPNSQRTPGD